MGRAQIRAQERRWRRGDSLALFAAVALGVALAWILLSVQGLQDELRTSNDARDALAKQVQSLGGTPVAGPPGSRGEPGKTVIGARGPTGPSGPPGEPAPTITPSPGPGGPPGPSGAPGADSTVAGPTGPAGASGAPGQNGQDGKDGSDGTNGAPPSSWTYTDQDGNEYRCVPVSDFDPDNPRYTCTQTSTASPDPSPTPSDQPSPNDQPSPSDQPSPNDSSSTGLLPLTLLDRRRI
jgi:hypothetical protein